MTLSERWSQTPSPASIQGQAFTWYMKWGWWESSVSVFHHLQFQRQQLQTTAGNRSQLGPQGKKKREHRFTWMRVSDGSHWVWQSSLYLRRPPGPSDPPAGAGMSEPGHCFCGIFPPMSLPAGPTVWLYLNCHWAKAIWWHTQTSTQQAQ